MIYIPKTRLLILIIPLLLIPIYSPHILCQIDTTHDALNTLLLSIRNSPEKLPDWADGFFTGYYNFSTHSPGSIQGYIKLGRQSTTGIFQGQWTTLTTEKNGLLKGVFHQNRIYGYISIHNQPIPIPFLGTLTHNDTHFIVHIPREQKCLVTVTGIHHASFLPTPTGPYLLGTEIFHLIDSNRDEKFTEEIDDNREIMMQLWYPRANTSNTHYTPYMDPPTFQWLKKQSPIPLFMIPDHAYTFIHTHALTKAPPLRSNAPFPLIIFSHGYDGVRAIYTSLIENLASHGFIIAAIDHPYIAGITIFPDGRTIDLAPVPTNPTEAEEYFNTAFDTVIGDITFALDFLTDLATNDMTWNTIIDLTHIGVYGHSFGGGAAAMMCFLDERVSTGLALDGFFQGDVINQGFDKPFLMMLAEGHFDQDDTSQALWKNITGGAYRAEVMGSTHYGYTDVGILLTHLTPMLPRKMVGFGTIEPKRLIAITNAYEQAFFGVHLQGKNLDSLLHLSNLYEEVSFEYKP